MSLDRVTRITPRLVCAAADESARDASSASFTWSGRDRLERTVVIAAIGLAGDGDRHLDLGAAGEPRPGRRRRPRTCAPCRPRRSARTISRPRDSEAARRRATARTLARLSPLPATVLVRAARAAALAERRALALPPGKAATRAQGAAATRLTTTLKLINVTERGAGRSRGLATLRSTQSRAWAMTLTAFFSGLLLLGRAVRAAARHPPPRAGGRRRPARARSRRPRRPIR